MAKFLQYLALTLFLCTACIRPLAPQTPTPQPIYTLTVLPTDALHATQTPVPTATPFPAHQPASTAALVPEWVTKFSDPIFFQLAQQKPNYTDDLSGLNQGWFYVIPDSKTNPHYAHVENEALVLKIPDGKEKKDSMVYNPRLAYKNFAVSFDFKFNKTQPQDVFRFQFSQGRGRSNIHFDLSKHEDWDIEWGLSGEEESISGNYGRFPPQRINVAFILYEETCAVYLNHDPLGYLENCRANPNAKLSPTSFSFHLLSVNGYDASLEIDNISVWDLDTVPNLP